MNFKTRAIGLLAGSALALSLAGGAMAQQGTSVELLDAGCEAVLDGADVNFGTYTWDGSAWVSDSNAVNTTLTADVTDGTQAQDGCDVTFAAGEMTGTGGVIDVVYNDGTQTAANPLTVTNAPAGDLTVDVEIVEPVDTAFDAGTYSGTVTISAENGS